MLNDAALCNRPMDKWTNGPMDQPQTLIFNVACYSKPLYKISAKYLELLVLYLLTIALDISSGLPTQQRSGTRSRTLRNKAGRNGCHFIQIFRAKVISICLKRAKLNQKVKNKPTLDISENPNY